MTPTSGPDFEDDFDAGVDADHPHRLELSFQYDDERRARLIYESVAVEVGEIDDDRSTARVAVDAETLSVTVIAHDLVALRAGTNTWIRLVETAEAILDIVDGR